MTEAKVVNDVNENSTETRDIEDNEERGRKTVILKGMGRVINKTVSLAEILKRQVKGVHHYAEIGSVKIVENQVESDGDKTNDAGRLLSAIKIVLTSEPDANHHYQPPSDEKDVESTLIASTLRREKPKQGRKGRLRVERGTTTPPQKMEKTLQKSKESKVSLGHTTEAAVQPSAASSPQNPPKQS